ncbi:MAG: SDR family oxidoreductase [Janthinobacterium lividum]
MTVLVTGASGFVGRHICEGLVKIGHPVRGLVRQVPVRKNRVDGVEYIRGVDVADAVTLTSEMFVGVEAIIHLVGIIQEVRSKGQTFQRVHVEGTRNVVDEALRAGFDGRIVYMSAIGSSMSSPSEYSQTKYQAERIVIGSNLPYTIFRPSLIIGADGEFVAQMQDLVLHGGLPISAPFPFIPVPGSGFNLFQPIWIDDLVDCVTQSLTKGETINHLYEVGGGTQLSFNELLKGFARSLGKPKKPLLHAPIPLLYAAATIMEKIIAKPPVTRDQLKNLGVDNITTSLAVKEVFGIDPENFEQMLVNIYRK